MSPKMKERGLFVLGLAICFGVAGLSVLVERLVPGDGIRCNEDYQ